MRCTSVLGLLVLGAAALSITGCAAANSTADLIVTYNDGAEQITQEISLNDLSCRKSSVNRTIVSDSVTSEGQNVFLATAPTEDRKSYLVSVWFDGHRFLSIDKFDPSRSAITFDELPGFITESPDGHQPASEDTEATLNGTIDCG